MIKQIVFYFTVFYVYTPVFGRPSFSNYEHSYPFCSRACWKATPPTDTRPITTPVPYVVIHHTAVPGACNTSADCTQAMKSMQTYHNSLQWGDIGYQNYLGLIFTTCYLPEANRLCAILGIYNPGRLSPHRIYTTTKEATE